MKIQTIQYFLIRDLNKLKTEIELYQNENDIWKVEQSIANSAGVLARHLVGNLNHYIGHIICGTNYKRDRIYEFSDNKDSKEKLLQQIEETIKMLESHLPNVTQARLEQEFELDFYGKQSTYFYLIQFVSHLAYHLGQINYHRRIIG